MSTLRVSNIEAKADASSPSVNEKIKITNSNGDVLIHVNGETAGITTVGINTIAKTFDVDTNQNVSFTNSIGIGSDNPTVKLDIVDSGSPNIALRGSSFPSIRYSALDGTTDAEIYYGIGGNDLVFNNVNAGPIALKTSNVERLGITSDGHVLPGANNTYDLGSTTKGWRNVYTNDFNLSNMNGDKNDVDGTQGSWTIQEGKNDLFLINRLNGKKYKFNLTEVL
tara:strand:+ start:290 stop:961 length:672 start_codon:yes stop_codon:yes gene_type:complete